MGLRHRAWKSRAELFLSVTKGKMVLFETKPVLLAKAGSWLQRQLPQRSQSWHVGHSKAGFNGQPGVFENKDSSVGLPRSDPLGVSVRECPNCVYPELMSNHQMGVTHSLFGQESKSLRKECHGA